LLRRVRSPNAIIANSQSVADDAEQVLGDGVEIRTIHNGIDLQRYSPDGPALDLDKLAGFAPAEPGTVRVGLVATFALWKGHLTFLEAIANVLARRTGCLPAVRAYVIGGPLYETKGSQHALAELRGAARRLGVESTVAFTGFIPDTASAMRALDIVVHASTAPEPFGLVIAEAMATGRAVIVSFAGGAKELVRPEVDALAHQPGDAAGLARSIERLTNDVTLRQRLGSAARSAANERFDPDRTLDQVLGLYAGFEKAVPV
jgi:glycosyltransferase involved in cell wall biosynthesis